MARRKRKMNKRAVLVLVGILVLLMAGLGAYGYRKRYKLLPPDPAAVLKEVDALKQQGEWAKAHKAFMRRLLGAYPKPVHFYLFAQFELEYINAKGKALSDAQRQQLIGLTFGSLNKAIAMDPNYLDAHRMLAELAWGRIQLGQQMGVVQANDWQEYIARADRIIQLDPKDFVTVARRATAYTSLAEAVPGANTEKAIADWATATQLKPDEPGFWIGLSGALMSARRTDQAQDVFTQGLEKCPNSVQLRVQYARYLMERREYPRVLEQVQQAIAAQPNDILGHLALADYYRLQRQDDQAMEALLQAQQVDNTDDRVYRTMAAILMAKGDVPKGIDAVRQGLALVQQRLDALEDNLVNQRQRARLSDSRSQLALFLANTLVDQAEGDQQKQAQYVAEAKQLLADQTLDVYKLYRDRVNGRIAFLEGDYKTACSLLESVQQRGGDYTTATTLVRIYFRQQLFGKAEDILDGLSANEVYRDSPGLLLLRAMLQMQYRNYPEAERYLSELLRKDSTNKQAASMYDTVERLLGKNVSQETPTTGPTTMSAMSVALLLDQAQTLWSQEERAEAISLLEDLHKRVPDDLTVSLRLLVMYALNNQDPQAQEVLAQAKASHPDKAELLDLQRQFLAEKDTPRRLEIRMKMADLNPDAFSRATEKAVVCMAFGDVAGYEAHLREALEVKPGDRPVTDRLLDALLARQAHDEAQKLVDQAAAANLDGMGGKFYQGRLAMAQGKYDAAQASFNEALTADPSSRAVRALLGQVYLSANQLDKASEQFTRVIQDDPSYVPAVIGMAIVTERLGQKTPHAAYIEQAYRLSPRDMYVLAQYLDIHEDDLPITDLIHERERLARRNASDSNNLVRLAKLYERVNRPEQAEGLLAALFKQCPDAQKLAAAQELVGFYARNSRSGEADKLMMSMLDSWPDKVGVWILYGNFLRQVSADQARKAFSKAATIDPNDPRGHQALATLLADRAEWAAAAEAMGRYLQIRPGDDVAREQWARFQINGMQLDQAGATLDQILARKPNDPAARTLQAVALMKQRNTDQAMEQLNGVLRDFPQFAEAMVTRSNLHLFLGQLAQAQADLEAASSASGSPEIALQLASMHLQAGEKEQCSMVLRDLLDRPDSRNYRPAQRMLMSVYLGQQRWNLLEALLEQVKKTDPYDPAVWLVESQMWSARGDVARSVAALEQAATVAPRSPLVLRDYLQGLLAAGQYQKALDLAQQRMSPEMEPILKAVQGRALAKLNHPQEADHAFIDAVCKAPAGQLDWVLGQAVQTWGPKEATTQAQRWLQTKPEELMMYLAGGKLALVAGNAQAAEGLFGRGLALAKQPAQRVLLNRELALCYYQSRQLDQAQKTYLAVLQDDPNDLASLNNLSYLYTNDLNQPEKALPYIQKAVQQTPYNADILDTYGWTLAKLQRPREAEVFLSQAVQANSASALCRYHLGWVYEQTRRFADAQRQYQSAQAAMAGQPDPELGKTLSEALARMAAQTSS